MSRVNNSHPMHAVTAPADLGIAASSCAGRSCLRVADDKKAGLQGERTGFLQRITTTIAPLSSLVSTLLVGSTCGNSLRTHAGYMLENAAAT